MDNTLLLVGNANTGKTTFFNALTNKNQKTGNWHGVTNSEFFGNFKIDKTEYTLVDLPGIYSLSPLSFEEQVATNCVLANTDKLCLNICEQDNITRNLYLTLQLLEAGVQTILIVNTKNKKLYLDLEKLSQKLGIVVVEFKNKKSIKKIKQTIKNFEIKKNYKKNYIQTLLDSNKFDLCKKTKIQKINTQNKKNIFFAKIFENKFFLKLKSKNKKNTCNCENCDKCEKKQNNLKSTINFEKLNTDFVKIKLLERDELFLQNYECNFDECGNVAKARYKYIDSVLKDQKIKSEVYGKSKFDKILLNKYLALPIFFLILIGIFYLTFYSVGAYLGDLFESGIACLCNYTLPFLTRLGVGGWFLDMIEGAVFGGIGSVLSFLPQVCLLFLFLSILEDTGYLSRVAFLFEDILCKVGLSGKGVYTLLMGFGCSATSIMTARNMEDKNAKIKIALITPFFSCSAKLPIYAVIGGAFFGASNVFVIFGLYVLGSVLGILICSILDKTLYKSKQQSFILEFAPLQLVGIKKLVKVVWENTKQFLIRIGSLIISVNVIVWIVSNFSFDFRYVQIYNCPSMLESLGKILAPIFEPLGFGNWGAAAALLAGLIAKEIVVSSIAIFNNVNHDESRFAQSLYDPSSAVFFTPQSAISFLVFCLLYTPCVSALAVVKGEFGTKYAIVSLLGQFAVAYIVSFSVYNLLALNLKALAIEILFLVLLVVVIGLCKKHVLKKQKANTI